MYMYIHMHMYMRTMQSAAAHATGLDARTREMLRACVHVCMCAHVHMSQMHRCTCIRAAPTSIGFDAKTRERVSEQWERT